MPRDCTLKSEKGWGSFSSNFWYFGRPEKKIRFIENALGLKEDPGTGVKGHVDIWGVGTPLGSDQNTLALILLVPDLTGLALLVDKRCHLHRLPLGMSSPPMTDKRGPRRDIFYVGRLLGEDHDLPLAIGIDDYVAGRLKERLALGPGFW